MKRLPSFLSRGMMILSIVCMLWGQATAPAYAKFSFDSTDVSAVVGIGIGCSSQIKDGVNFLSNQLGFGNIFGSSGSSAGSSVGNSVPVGDKTTQNNTSQAAEAAKSTDKKLRCLNALDKAAAQEAIKEITKATAGWVNGGFQGGTPIYVVDEASFLQQIKDEALITFTNQLMANSQDYPFGHLVARGIVTSMNQTFAERNKYTLDSVIQDYTGNSGSNAKDFQGSFSNGGWSAFDAQFQTQNNPFGFQMAAEDAANNAVFNNAKVQQTKDELQRNQGFLDLKKCVSKKNDGSCQRYETQTPGSVVVNQLNTVLGSPLRQLENGQDLSQNLSKVFDVLITQLMNKGLSYLAPVDDGGLQQYSNNDGYAENVSVKNGKGDGFDPTDCDPEDSESAPWYAQNCQFDILTDIPDLQAKIHDYLLIVAQEGSITPPRGYNTRGVIQDIMDSIYELDYCIPGPNPNWERQGNEIIQALIEALPGSNGDALPVDPVLQEMADRIYGKNAQIGYVSSFSQSSGTLGFALDIGTHNDRGLNFADTINAASGGSDDDASKNKRMYWVMMRLLLGIDYDNDASSIQTKQNASRLVQTVWQRYRDAMNARYNLGTLPSEANPNTHSYRNLQLLSESLQENAEVLSTGDALIKQLDQLQKRVEDAKQYQTSDPDLFLQKYKGLIEIFKVISTDIPDSDVINEASANLETLKSQYDTLANKDGGYVSMCVQETSDPNYIREWPTTRVAYPKELLPNDRFGFKLSKSFLPGFSYDGPGALTTEGVKRPAIVTGKTGLGGFDRTYQLNTENVVKVSDLVYQVNGSASVKADFKNGKLINNYFGQFSHTDNTVYTNADGLSVFEKLIGVY